MDEAGNPQPSEQVLIDLKVLSPSTEVNGDLFFANIPAVTTVGELKIKIRDELATRPAVERMRLIYRGRVMAKDTDSMFDVFGRDNIQRSTEQSLHLVLREFGHSTHPNTSTSSTPTPRNSATPAPRSSTAPPNPFRTGPPSPAAGTSVPPQTNPFRAPPQVRPNSTPHLSHIHQNPFPHTPQFPPQGFQFAMNPEQGAPHLRLPPEFNNILQQQFAQAAQVHAAHAHNGAHRHMHPPQGQQNGAPEGGTGNGTGETAARNAFQELVAQQQQQRAAAGSRGVGTNGERRSPSENRDRASSESRGQPGLQRGLGNLPPNSSSTIRHEGIGPNGERWTMTINNTNVTLPEQRAGVPQPQNIHRLFPYPPNFQTPFGRTGTPPVGTPSPSIFNNGAARPAHVTTHMIDRDLVRIRTSLQGAQREMENVRMLVQGPSGEITADGATTGTSPPTWRHDQIRRHVHNLMQNLEQLQTGLNSLVADPDLARNRDVVSLQMLNNSLRTQAGGLLESIDRLRPGNTVTATTNGTTSSNNTLTTGTTSEGATEGTRTQAQQQATRSTPSTRTSNAPSPEFFILSGPQGPVGVLFDERGTYTTAPFAPTISFDAFNQQFTANRQILAALGQQMAQHHQQPFAPPLHPNQPHQVQNANPAPGAAPAAPGAAAQPGQPAAQAQAQAPAQPQNDRMVVAAGHLWLLFKLLCFIYLFAGGSGWRRPIMMGVAGAVVYLAQLGLFENQFERLRRHFEALLPLPERERQPPNPQQANGEGGGAERSGAGQGADAARMPTPEEAARRLVRERDDRERGWLRERVRVAERAVALFVASLWPGLGERMVQAREDRNRAEREEERRTIEEDQARVEREASEQEEKDKEKIEVEQNAEGESSGGKGKGKEKVELPKAETEAEASGSGSGSGSGSSAPSGPASAD